MELSTIANVATALTVITGVAFGLVEAQRSRRARQERAAYAAVQAILSPEWMKSMIVVHSIPDGSNASAIEADAGVLNAAHVEEERRRSGSQKTFEWFQWLATQLERHSPGKTNLEMGAHQAYQDWDP